MELFLYWILRASILMALFYSLYKIFFANNTFHSVNRFMLLSVLPVISLLPLFRFHLIPERVLKPETVTTTFTMDLSYLPVTELVEVEPRMEIPWMEIAMVLFGIGVLFTLIRYLTGLSQIITLIRKSEKEILADHTVLCVTDRNISPFSWMKYIVISRKDLFSDGEAVIRHEKAHIFLYHSIDMIFFDLFSCIFWFNPFSWLLRREIQSVHEYQADQQVLNNGIDTKQYQLLLIRKSVGEYKFALANNFRQRDLHKRITMMKKNKTDRRMKWNYLMTLPAVLLAMIALSVPKLNASIPEKKSNEAIEKGVVERVTDAQGTKDSVIITVEDVDVNANPLDLGKAKITPKGSVLTIRLKEDEGYWIRGIDTINHPLIFIDDQKASTDALSKLDPNNIKSFSVLKDATAVDIYGVDGKHGVVLVTTKEYEKDATTTEAATEKPLQRVEKEVIAVRGRNPLDWDQMKENPPLIFIDGEKMPKDFDISSIDPSDIESLSVLKGKASIDAYDVEGKNGAILFTTKNPKKKKQPLQYTADSIIVSSFKNNTDTVSSLTISTTSTPSLTYISSQSNFSDLKEFVRDRLKLKVENSDKTLPLIIVDGEKKPKDFDLNSIPMDGIKSISVRQGDSSSIYGEEGKNGVVNITTKKL